MLRLIPIIAASALIVLSCQKESKPNEPATPQRTPVEEVAEVIIASVTLLEDCLDEASAVEEKEQAADDMDRESMPEGYSEPCRQSTMQFAVTGQGETSANLRIVEVRLLGPKGATLDTLKTRSPSIWQENRYSPWDQVILPKTDVKASYKLSLGNWSKVEQSLGGSSYGPKFLVEADIDIGGVRKTVRSSHVVREPAEMIDT